MNLQHRFAPGTANYMQIVYIQTYKHKMTSHQIVMAVVDIVADIHSLRKLEMHEIFVCTDIYYFHHIRLSSVSNEYGFVMANDR